MRISCTDSRRVRNTRRAVWRTIAIALVVSLTIALLAGCPAEEEDKPLTIAVTYTPLFYFTREVAGLEAEVISIIPNGVEPHGYTPTASDLSVLEEADVLVVLGTERNILTAQRTDIFTIHALTNVPLLRVGAEDEHAHDEDEEEHAEDEHEEEHAEEVGDGAAEVDEHAGHAHGTIDVHAWLSPRYAATMVRNIMEGLITIDMENSSEYQANAAAYIEELSGLARNMKNTFSNCSQDYILVTHNAFSYLAHEYDFRILSVYDAEPDVEPSASKFISLIQDAKKHDIKYMFYNDLFDTRIPESIAEQIGATLLPLYSVEYAPTEYSTYFSIMNTTIENLVTALQCQ